MKLIEAITRIDKMKSNPYELSEKLTWLSALDGMVKAQILDTHRGGDALCALPYTEETPDDTQLLIPAPHDQIYIWWLGAQMDYWSGEITRYNNAMALFNAGYEAFANQYHREHPPLPLAGDFQ